MFKDELIQKLEEVSLGMRKARTRVFSEAGLAPGQARVLSSLFEYGDLSQADLARIIEISGPTVKKLVENLVNSGMIEIRPSDSDKRINIVALTPLGRKQEKTVRSCIGQLREIATRGFSEPEIIMTGMLLSRIGENLRAEVSDDPDFETEKF